jgi:hypothetical protein
MRRNETGPQPMRDRPGRKFTVADIMILVAAAAVGALLLRVLVENRTWYPPGLRVPLAWKYGLEASPLLLSFPIALLLMRARAPRPPARRVFRQPGTVACLAVLVTFFTHSLSYVARTWLGTFFNAPITFGVEVFVIQTLYTGHSVALVWAVMALTRTWRPEASWIDRAGRAYGVLMIVVWLLTTLDL